MDLLSNFDRFYNQICVSEFDSKYLPFSKLQSYLDLQSWDKTEIGKSFLGNSIYVLKLGSGKKQILTWSQMHGNESTGTRAMLDVWNFLQLDIPWVKEILNEVTFHFIPMLNPDGSVLYTRRNAIGVDLNRDFLKESSPEIKVLKDYVKAHSFDCMFNLHDQRTIFNVSGTKNPATLSFLAPSADLSRCVTDTRKKAMSVVYYMYENLKTVMGNQIARFSDEFYPYSTGDNFTALEIPTVLFEAGHFSNDYNRDKVRKFNALAILIALESIAKESECSVEQYHEIPSNQSRALDVIIRNVRLQSNCCDSLVDIGIYFEELLNSETKEIEFVSKILEIGDLRDFFGHIDVDMKGELFKSKKSFYPQINDIADFSVGNIHFQNGKLIN